MDTIRILLIDPPGGQVGINVGLAYLAGSLRKKGFIVKVVDLNNNNLSMQELKRVVEEFKPRLIGYSVKTATYKSAVDISKFLKESYPYALHVVGGPHITLYYENFLYENRHIDLAFIGEAEESLLQVSRLLQIGEDFRKVEGIAFLYNDSVVEKNVGRIQDLDSLSNPSFEDFTSPILERFGYPLVTSRGCPYGCIFCCVGDVSGNKWRSRNPENIIGELKEAITRYQVREFEIYDDTFTQDVKRAIEICDLLMSEKIELRWSCMNGIRADRVDEELAKKMAKAGCHTVMLGIESGEPSVFTQIGKGEKLKDIEMAVRLFKGVGIRVGGYFIIGLPGDSYIKTKRSLAYAKWLNLDWAHFNILSPYPGTKVWEWLTLHGKLREDFTRSIHFGEKVNPIFDIPTFSHRGMIKAYRMVHTKLKLFHLLFSDKTPTWNRRLRRLLLYIQFESLLLPKRIWRFICVARYIIRFFMFRWFLRLIKPFNLGTKGRKVIVKSRDCYSTKATLKKNLKILHVNNYYAPIGGTEHYLIDVCEALEEKGYKIIVAYSEGHSETLRTPFRKVYHIPHIAEYNGIYNEEAERRFIELVKTEDPSVINLHNVWNPSIIRIAKRLRPTVRYIHDHNSLCPALNKLFKVSGKICFKPLGLICIKNAYQNGCMSRKPYLLSKQLAKKFMEVVENRNLSKVIVSSNYMRHELIKNQFMPERIAVLPYYIENLDRFLEESPQGEIILSVGRFSKEKGFDVLLEVIKNLPKEWYVMIAGDGPERRGLVSRVNEMGISTNVQFQGWLDKEALDNLYRKARVVIMPSLWPEPFGKVGIEAMSYGKPVVAFDVGGIREWLEDDKTGFLVERGNVVEMVEKTKRLLKDSDLSKRMGLVGIAAVKEKFNRQRHIKRLCEIYHEISK